MSALLTWLLHGLVLTAGVALVLHAARSLEASTRYCLWWAAMAAVLALPVAHVLSAPRTSGSIDAAPAPVAVGEPAAGAGDRARLVVPASFSHATPWLAAAALGFALWRLLALARAADRLRRVRARTRPLPAPLDQRLGDLRDARSRARGVEIRVTRDLATPALLGPHLGAGRAPIVALPEWALDTLEIESLDLLVRHELAHVERDDDRDLLVQSAIAAVFGWHPAVWWIGRRLHDERERACDDIVVARSGRAAQYARCLVDVAERELLAPPLLAAGLGRAGRRLTARVERLLHRRSPRSPRASRAGVWVGVGGLLLASAIVVSAAGAPTVRLATATWGSIQTSSMTTTPEPSSSGSPAVVRRFDAAGATPAPRSGLALRPRHAISVSQPVQVDPQSLPSSQAIATQDPAPDSTPGPSPDPTPGPTREPAVAAVAADPPLLSMAGAGAVPLGGLAAPSAPLPAAPPPAPPPGPWQRTADAGEAVGKGAARAGESIGRGATEAGVKTAGFFSRMGRAVARSF